MEILTKIEFTMGIIIISTILAGMLTVSNEKLNDMLLKLFIVEILISIVAVLIGIWTI